MWRLVAAFGFGVLLGGRLGASEALSALEVQIEQEVVHARDALWNATTDALAKLQIGCVFSVLYLSFSMLGASWLEAYTALVAMFWVLPNTLSFLSALWDLKPLLHQKWAGEVVRRALEAELTANHQHYRRLRGWTSGWGFLIVCDSATTLFLSG
jgi:hypothetical protein